MARKDNISISDELLAAYLEGNASAEEIRLVLQALEGNRELQEILITAERVDNSLNEDIQTYISLPISHLAAEGEDSLCDLQCEEYILRRRNIPFDSSALSAEARSNCWLKEKGTPLHSIGRLLEQKGLSVTRSYNATIESLAQAIDKGHDIITVVNSHKLSPTPKDASDLPNHAVVVVECNLKDGYVNIFNPDAEGKQQAVRQYPVARFGEAWNDSCCYMVCIKTKDNTYNPQPIDIEDIDLTDDLLELREAIAENAHDVWGAARIREGWSYGPVRNDTLKQHPDLVPYADLPDEEKEYDRQMAINTIKLVKKLGYEIVKQTDTQLYKLLIGRLHRQEDTGHCLKCGAAVFIGQAYCEKCGTKVGWEDVL